MSYERVCLSGLGTSKLLGNMLLQGPLPHTAALYLLVYTLCCAVLCERPAVVVTCCVMSLCPGCVPTTWPKEPVQAA